MASHSSIAYPPSAPAAPPAPRSPATPGLFTLAALVVLVVALGPLAYVAVSPPLEDAPVRLTEVPGGRVEYLQDRSGKLTLADVATAAGGGAFHPIANAAHDGSLMRLPAPRVNWLRLMLPNENPAAVEVVLQFSNLDLDAAEIFSAPDDAVGGSNAPIARTGLRVRPAERSLRSHLPAFAVRLPAKRTTTIYVRNPSDSDSTPGSIALWRSLDEFRRHEQRQVLPLAIFFALGATLFLYHALAGVVRPERLTPLYLSYIATITALALVASNMSAWFIPRLAGVPREAAVLGLLGAAAFVRVHFCRTLLAASRVAPKAETALHVISWIAGAATLTAPALLIAPELLPLATRVVSIAAVFSLVALPVIAAHAGWRGVRHAPLAGIAFTCMAAGLGWIVLGRYGLVSADRTDGMPLIIGTALEFLLVGVAIAQRQRFALEEREAWQASQATRLQREAADAKGDLLSLAHQLAQSKQDKDRIISMIAQEVRAPLASLLAVSRSLPPDRAAEQLPLIRRRCTALIELLNNLLDWARLRTGKFPHDPEPVNLAALADTALGPLDGTATDKAVRLECKIPSSLTVRVDRAALQCVLRNLAGNALKFTATGGMVCVDARLSANMIELRVQDCGVGMTAEQLAPLQPSAMTADLPTTPGTAGETGAGVGLAIVRELLDRNGGTLRFESTLGRGTSVIVTLPAEVSSTGAPPAAVHPARHAAPALR